MPTTEATPLILAMRDLELGVAELPGDEDHPRILVYHAHTSLNASADAVSWCSAAMCAWHEEAGIPSPRSAAARDWMAWGIAIEGWQNVRPGDVMVEWRSHPDSWKGHVSMIVDWPVHSASQTVVGGNQRERGMDRVCIKERLTDKVLGYRRWVGDVHDAPTRRI